MNKKTMFQLALFAFLFTFGVLFGIESKRSEKMEEDARANFENPTYYISRIENGKFVYEPVHHQSNFEVTSEIEHDPKVNQEEPMNEKVVEKSEGPRMKNEGRLDSIGQSLGAKLSEFTRTTLEISLGFFAD